MEIKNHFSSGSDVRKSCLGGKGRWGGGEDLGGLYFNIYAYVANEQKCTYYANIHHLHRFVTKMYNYIEYDKLVNRHSIYYVLRFIAARHMQFLIQITKLNTVETI